MIKYKADLHIPTVQYGFILLKDVEGTTEELIGVHDGIMNEYNDESSLSASEWKKARETMLRTGEFDPNDGESLSKAQAYFINQAKLAFRAIKEEK